MCYFLWVNYFRKKKKKKIQQPKSVGYFNYIMTQAKKNSTQTGRKLKPLILVFSLFYLKR